MLTINDSRISQEFLISFKTDSCRPNNLPGKQHPLRPGFARVSARVFIRGKSDRKGVFAGKYFLYNSSIRNISCLSKFIQYFMVFCLTSSQ